MNEHSDQSKKAREFHQLQICDCFLHEIKCYDIMKNNIK